MRVGEVRVGVISVEESLDKGRVAHLHSDDERRVVHVEFTACVDISPEVEQSRDLLEILASESLAERDVEDNVEEARGGGDGGDRLRRHRRRLNGS
jgi:hypothetical protein